MAKKVEKKDNRKLFIIIGGVVLVVIALILIILLATNKPKKEEKKKEEPKTPAGEVVETNENTMIKDYGFSKEDAINAVKPTYQSDNYTFTAVANANNTYTVIVENAETGEVTKWTVDPSDGSRSMDD